MLPNRDHRATCILASPADGAPAAKISRLHVLLIVLVGTLVRVPFYLAYRPILSGDSEGYASVYALWRHHHFFLGERTPVYPLLLGLAQWIARVPPARTLSGPGAYAAVVLQSAIDVLVAPLFYLGLRALRIRPRTALGFTLLLATIPAVCNYEMNILNMSFSFAWLIVVVSFFLFTVRRAAEGKSIGAYSVATGIFSSLAVLNRPEFLIFVLLLLACSALIRSPTHAPLGSWPLGKSALIVALSATPAILAWMTLMYAGIGQFRITTLDGWNRSRTVYNLFDRVGPEDRVIGQIMAETYEAEMQHGGVNIREIVWPAEPKIFQHLDSYPQVDVTANPSNFHLLVNRMVQQSFGLVQLPCRERLVDYCWEMMRIKIDTGDYLGDVSTRLALRYPGAWLRNVVTNFFEESFNFDYFSAKASTADFMAVAAGASNIVIHPAAAKLVELLCKADVPLLLLTYLITLGYFLLSPAMLLARGQCSVEDAAVAALAVASIGTIVGTCILAGFNRVYSLPHLVVFTLCSAYVWEQRSRLFSRLVRKPGA